MTDGSVRFVVVVCGCGLWLCTLCIGFGLNLFGNKSTKLAERIFWGKGASDPNWCFIGCQILMMF